MLDDPKYIQQFDSDDALGVLARQHEQLLHSFDVKLDIDKSKINTIVVVGMGGSALAGQLVRTWWLDRLSLPLIVVRDYDLPAFVGESTLVICSSYSGNTEETLNAYAQAGDRGAPRVAMASGGKLADLAAEDGVPLYELPSGYQPRMAMWYGTRALTELMESLGFVDDCVSSLEAASELLKEAVQEWREDVPTSENRAKRIAESCLGKAVWIYSGPKLASAAYKWKISINESSKHVASWNELPEFNHNEYLGWTEQPAVKPFTVIQLWSAAENERVQKRFEVTNRLLSGRMPAPVVVETRGENHIQHLLWACLLGDYVSVYLGVLNNVNPTKVDDIEKFKRELGQDT